jgi:hypothetical protein
MMRVVTATLVLQATVEIPEESDGHIASERLRKNLNDLVLIKHRSRKDWHGVTAIVIPQCSGDDPLAFFMYPGHQKGIIKALGEIRKVGRKMKGWDR